MTSRCHYTLIHFVYKEDLRNEYGEGKPSPMTRYPRLTIGDKSLDNLLECAGVLLEFSGPQSIAAQPAWHLSKYLQAGI